MTTVRELRRLGAATGALVDGARDSRAWVRALAALSIVVLGLRIELPQGVELGYIVAAALTPVWIRSLAGHRLGWWLLGSGVLAAGAGIALQLFSANDHAVNSTVATSSTVMIIGSMLSVGLVIWARTVVTSSRVALFFGIGLLLSVSPSTPLFAENPWKFGFYIPVAIIVLALSQSVRRWWVDLVVILALTGISAVSDARSAFGLLILAAVLVVAQLPFFRAGHRGSALLVLGGILVVALGVAYFGQAAILDGYLGQATQLRSEAQIQASGSLLFGGRPELAATIALMGHSIWGFGAGIVPSAADVVVAKTGMTSIGYDPDNNYVNGYMFGGHIELHSTIGDLWAQAGVVGLLFAAVMLFALIWPLARRIAIGEASGIVLFLVGDSVFNLFFSPYLSSVHVLILALGLVLLPTAAQQAENGEAPSPVTRLVDRRPRFSQGVS